MDDSWSVLGFLLFFFIIFCAPFVPFCLAHLRYENKSLPTKKDYASHAHLVGNGGHFFGGYDFYVIICPGCRHNEEHIGCPNCKRREAKVTLPPNDYAIHIKCPKCRQEPRLAPCCSECGAIVAPPFINFYRGNFVPQVQVNKRETRGQTPPEQQTRRSVEMPPEQQTARRGEMPPDVPPPKRRMPRI